MSGNENSLPDKLNKKYTFSIKSGNDQYSILCSPARIRPNAMIDLMQRCSHINRRKNIALEINKARHTMRLVLNPKPLPTCTH